MLRERRGQEVYNANCLSCHGGPVGGRMEDYPPRHTASGHTWHHPDCALKQIIRDGSSPMTEAMREMMAPPDAPKMLPFKDLLSAEDIDAVLAYIKTMWTPDQRELQASFTEEMCFEAMTSPSGLSSRAGSSPGR
jgi:mono/diheme cytochrome c family protein